MVGKFWLKLGKLPGHLVIDFSAMHQDERATAAAAAAAARLWSHVLGVIHKIRARHLVSFSSLFKLDSPFFNLGSTSGSIGSGGQGQPLRVCVGCSGPILDQYILRVAPNLEWHAACLKCSQCQKFLDEKCTCFVRDGKIYCKEDYVRYYNSK